MPYDSAKQRRWAHTASAKAKGFPTAEYDRAERRRRKKKRRAAGHGPLHDAMVAAAT